MFSFVYNIVSKMLLHQYNSTNFYISFMNQLSMKYFFAFFIFGILSTHTFSQNLSTAPTGEAGLFSNAQGGNPMLNLVMMDLRSNKSNKTYDKTLGSPYSTENFIKSKVYYGKENQGDFYVRYNALNSIIEIKKTLLPEEKVKQLFADKNVRVKYLNKELRFTTYINKKKETKNGYLSLIMDGEDYKLYHRLAVKYSEGKSAANSMVADIPSRFAHFEEYYYQKSGVDRIDYLPLKKGNILKLVDKPFREIVKIHLKENDYNFTKEEDIILLFEYLNTL